MVIAFSFLVVVIKRQVGRLKMTRLLFDREWQVIMYLAFWAFAALC